MKFVKIFGALSIGRLAIAAAVLTVIYYMMSFDSGAALTEQINAMKGQINAEQSRKNDIEKTMKKEEEMRGNLLQLARNLEVLKSKIPNDFKETEMSSLVNRAAVNSDVKISILSKSPAVQAPRQAGSGAELIDEIIFDISASATFAQLIHFVDLLSKEEKVIRTRNFTIEKNSANVDDNTIKFKGEIVGYKQAPLAVAPTAGEVNK